MALYEDMRPGDFDEVIGQENAVTVLNHKIVLKDVPHVVLFHGPSGTGKTSIARILSQKLDVEPDEMNPNFVEMNCADCRSIDDIREIIESTRYAPTKGKARVWILDEVVQLPAATQQAMLKMLEGVPKHVYFFLCTTDKSKLLSTIISRCFPVQLQAIPDAKLLILAKTAFHNEEIKVEPIVLKKIVQLAEGSARQALQLVEKALAGTTTEQQLELLGSQTQESLGHQLAQVLVYKKGWSKAQEILRNLSQDHETVRRIVLKYCETILLDSKTLFANQAAARFIMYKFMDDWDRAGRPGLSAVVWEITNTKR